jgi:predicted DCC family thiol-disulfide oxidoreductase YuxK
MDPDKPILIFDGVCVLCSRLLRLVLWADQEEQELQFATAQSEIGQRALKELNLNAENFETVLLIYPNSDVHSKMDVVIEIGKILGGIWKALYILKILPRKTRNKLYDFIAARRYKWFGKSEYCTLIPEKYKDRIIR